MGAQRPKQLLVPKTGSSAKLAHLPRFLLAGKFYMSPYPGSNQVSLFPLVANLAPSLSLKVSKCPLLLGSHLSGKIPRQREEPTTARAQTRTFMTGDQCLSPDLVLRIVSVPLSNIIRHDHPTDTFYIISLWRH